MTLHESIQLFVLLNFSSGPQSTILRKSVVPSVQLQGQCVLGLLARSRAAGLGPEQAAGEEGEGLELL